ncbi:hypothetical protein B0O80DRAFT_469766 [Mortierella sp. GBAus27b]|nr:hypothetical protein B0O80DRAFT_469766 [Mortierella sp. GBAus27b]
MQLHSATAPSRIPVSFHAPKDTRCLLPPSDSTASPPLPNSTPSLFPSVLLGSIVPSHNSTEAMAIKNAPSASSTPFPCSG